MYNTSPALSTALNTQYIHLRLLAEAVPLMAPTAQPLSDSTGAQLFVLATDRLPDGQVEQENILSLSHTAVCCGSDIGIGGVYAASLSCTLNGSHSLLDVTLRAQIGAEVDGTVEWLPLGTFVVTDCRRGDDQTTLTAYDAAYYALGKDYVPTVNSGSTISAVLTDLAQQCGLAVEQDTLSMGTMTVDGDLSGHSCREMLGYLAGLCGRNAVVTRNGAIRFLWFAASGAAVTADDYYDGQLSNGGTSRLSGLTCTVPGDGDDREEQTLTVGDSALAVTLENPYMTQERLDAIWADVGDYAYPIGDVSFYGGVLTEPGDILTLTNREGVTISFPVMQVSLSLDGGCRCQISAFGQAETSRTSARTGPLSQAVQTAAETAGRALTTAKSAMTSANGKNKVFHQGSAPAASKGLTAGDIWFDTANDNRINRWTGAAWSAFELGEDAIANLSITNAKIADSTIQHAKIASLDMGAATTGKLKAKYIDVDSLFAQDITCTNSFQVDNSFYSLVINKELHGLDVVGGDIGNLGGYSVLRCVPYELSGFSGGIVSFSSFGSDDGSECSISLSHGEGVEIKSDNFVTVTGPNGINLDCEGLAGNAIILRCEGEGGIQLYGDILASGSINIAGTIGGFELANQLLRATSEINGIKHQFFVQGPDGTNSTNVFAVRRFDEMTSAWEYPFRVDYRGKLRAASIALDGTDITDLFSPKLSTATKTVSTGDVASNGTKAGTFSVSRSGYTPLGIVGWTTGTDTGNSLFNVTRLYLSGNTCNYLVRNMAGSAYSCDLTVNVLYVKN